MMHGWWGYGYRGGPGLVNWIGPAFMIILWALIVIGIVFFIRYMARLSRTGHSRDEDSMEILKKRYARGEINKEEFDQKRKDLGG